MVLFAFLIDPSLLGRAVGSTNYVAFVILGLDFQSWQGTALWSASGIFQDELSTGQIDYTFSCPFSRYWYIVCNIAASAMEQTIFFIPVLFIGLWFTRETLTLTGIILGLMATTISVSALAQLGAIFASLVLRYRQVSAIFSFFNFAFQMTTGMLIPIQLIPVPLQIIGQCLPMTFGIDLLRYYVMMTSPIMPIEYEWAALFAQLVAFSIMAKLAILYLERAAKKHGLHYI